MIWQYYQVTHDTEFMQFYGTELMLNIALFWSSMTRRINEQTGRYEIRGVMGPDEYHERYSGRTRSQMASTTTPITNIMAVWVLLRAREALDLLPDIRRVELMRSLGLRGALELARWHDITRSNVRALSRRWDHQSVRRHVAARRVGLGRLPDSLRQHPTARSDPGRRRTTRPYRYKLAKLARRAHVVLRVLRVRSSPRYWERLGYSFSIAGAIPRIIAHHDARSSHGSTLSSRRTFLGARTLRQASIDDLFR